MQAAKRKEARTFVGGITVGLNRRIFLVSLGSTGMLVACGGGGGTNPVPSGGSPTPHGTSTPTVSPSPTPSPTASPTPPANTVAFTIVNNNPAISSSSINIYVYGMDPSSGNWVYVKPDWTTAAWTQTAPFPAIPFYAGASGSGNTSQTIYLPQLTSARIYIAAGTLNFSNSSGPVPWTNDGNQNTTYDALEYTWNSGSNGMGVNTTFVDQVALAMSMNLVGAQNQNLGFKSGAITQIYNGINALGTPWSSVLSQWPHRILNASHVFYTGNAFSADATFLDSSIKTAWRLYKGQTLTLNAINSQGYTTLYGTVDASDNFQIYSDSGLTANVGTLAAPWSSTWTSTGTTTFQVLACAGSFGSYGSASAAAILQGIVGAMLGASLNRGVIDTSTGTPVAALNNCTSSQFYPGRPYQNSAAAQVHAVAKNTTYSYGDKAYAFSYDDVCNTYDPYITDTAPKSLTVTINPS